MAAMTLMRFFLFIAVLSLGLPAPGAAGKSPDPYGGLSSADLKNKIETVRARLDRLPLRLIRESGGTLGFRGQSTDSKATHSWVEIDLEQKLDFDTIMLVPAVMIDEHKECSNEDFPLRFQIHLYADAEDETGRLLFDSTTTPMVPPPNQSPVIIDCPGSSARRIRFTALEPFKSPIYPLYYFALSEMLVFDGERNLALGKPVKSPGWTKHRPIWHKNYLTDGYLPFSQPLSRETAQESVCRIHVPPQTGNASITMDLGREYPLDEIRLYPVHIGPNFAVFHRTALGFPRTFNIEVSKDAAFSSPAVVYDTRSTDYPSPGHRLACFSAMGATGRFVRITARRLPPHPQLKGNILAFGEIEVVAEGAVVSRGAKVSLSHQPEIARLPAAMLVDGLASNKKILPLRSWLTDLSERNLLEAQLETLQTELQRHYLRQSRTIRLMGWSVTAILAAALITYLMQRQIRQRHIYRLRENLAADLHDEIGGNFSGIALLCEELAHEEDMPETHIPQLMTVADISRASANNTRNLVRFLEARGGSGDLLAKMQALAEHLLSGQISQFDIEGAKHIGRLGPKDKWHLLLFFKEALTNIIKHAQATEVKIRLQLTAHRLRLSISDNGRGLPDNRLPTHLSIRAEKLKAILTLSTPPDGGTEITLEKKL